MKARSFARLLGAVACLVTTGVHAQIVVDSIDDDGGAGDCELREAIINANNDDQSGSTDCDAGSGTDTIDLTAMVGTITLNGTPLEVTSNLTIEGPGMDILSIDGNAQSRVFTIGGGTIVSIHDLTITNGRALDEGFNGEYGGGILNGGQLTLIRTSVTHNVAVIGSGIMNANSGSSPYFVTNGTLNIQLSEISDNWAPDTTTGNGGGVNNNVGSTLTILNSTFAGNRSNVGGAIYNNSTLTISSSTFSGNETTSSGGALYLLPGAESVPPVTITHTTITNNVAEGSGGGIFISVTSDPDTAHTVIYNSIIAKNSVLGDFSDGPDIRGPVSTSLGYNILGDDTDAVGMTNGVNHDQVGTGAAPLDPKLFVLANNGGYTRTHLPSKYSPAIDRGSCSSSSETVDQRLFSRPLDQADASYPNDDDGCDVGAVEVYEIELTGGPALDAHVFLQGAYVSVGTMSKAIFGDLPLSQPFSDAIFDGTAIEYDGLESVLAIPDSVVDWVLVSVRTGLGPETQVYETPAFLKQKGEIVGLDGGPLELPIVEDDYRVVVRHRNHISIMSSALIAFSGGTGIWDARTSSAASYTTGPTPLKDLSDGYFGMFAGDANADGNITAPDFNVWNAATTAGLTGYQPGDYNLDGIVTAPDFNLWNANTTAGAASQVPD